MNCYFRKHAGQQCYSHTNADMASPEVGDGQGRLGWFSPRGCRVGHDWVTVTELNTEMWSHGHTERTCFEYWTVTTGKDFLEHEAHHDSYKWSSYYKTYCIIQGSPENRTNRRWTSPSKEIYYKKELISMLWSFKICSQHMETRNSWCCLPVWVQRPGAPGELVV